MGMRLIDADALDMHIFNEISHRHPIARSVIDSVRSLIKQEKTFNIDHLQLTTANDVVDALDSVTWYNCLAELIIEWKKPGFFREEGGTLSWDWKKFYEYGKETQAQIEVIWMILVILFGNYGTSPRTGWIDDKNGFYEFLDFITTTYRESLR